MFNLTKWLKTIPAQRKKTYGNELDIVDDTTHLCFFLFRCTILCIWFDDSASWPKERHKELPLIYVKAPSQGRQLCFQTRSVPGLQDYVCKPSFQI